MYEEEMYEERVPQFDRNRDAELDDFAEDVLD